MAFLSFHCEWSLMKLSILLSAPIVNILLNLSLTYFFVNQQEKSSLKGFILLVIYLTYIPNGLLQILSNKLQKNTTTIIKPRSNLSKLIHQKDETFIFNRLSKLHSYIFMLIISILDLVGKIYEMNLDFDQSSDFFVLLDCLYFVILIVLLSYFSQYYLNYKLYRHHFVSLVFMIFSTLLMTTGFIIYYHSTTGFWTNLGLRIGNSIVASFAIALYVVMEKYLLQNGKFYPYYYLFIKGCITSFLVFICFFTSGNNYSQQCKDNTRNDIMCFFVDMKKISKFFEGSKTGLKVFLFISIIFLSFIYQILWCLTNYYFSPCHTGVSVVISSFANYLYDGYQEGGHGIKVFISFNIIGYAIFVFFILVYNEFIVIHAFGMDRNTNKQISERGNDDFMKMSLAAPLRRELEDSNNNENDLTLY